MAQQKGTSKPERTSATPLSDLTAWQAFGAQDRLTRQFSEALREGRCRPSGKFDRNHVVHTMDVLRPLTGAWNCEILFVLLVHGAQRFGALKLHLDGVSSRVLTDKLRHLEREALVARTSEGYRLAPMGDVVARHLHPIIFYLNHKREHHVAPA